MTRTAPAGFLAAAASAKVIPAGLVHLDFASGTVRVTDMPRNITIDADEDGTAETFQGIGNLGQIGSIQESASLRAAAVTLVLSGLNPAYVALALGDAYQGRRGKIWMLPLDNAHIPLVAPNCIFVGRMDTMRITKGAEASISVTLENILVDGERSPNLRFTDEDQKRRRPGDRFFEFVSISAEREVTWGSTKGPNWQSGS